IRMAAASLRNKLGDYYLGEGRLDPVEIQIPIGGYLPEIIDRRVSIGVTRIENWTGRPANALICSVIVDELIHQLANAGVIQVTNMTRRGPHPPLRFVVRGYLVTRTDEILQADIALVDTETGHAVVARPFTSRRDEILKLPRQVVDSIVTALN